MTTEEARISYRALGFRALGSWGLDFSVEGFRVQGVLRGARIIQGVWAQGLGGFQGLGVCCLRRFRFLLPSGRHIVFSQLMQEALLLATARRVQ